jgi:hypothetical protein
MDTIWNREKEKVHDSAYRSNPHRSSAAEKTIANSAGALQELMGGKFSELVVEDAIPRSFPPPDLDEEPQLSAPGIDPEFLREAAKRVFGA